MRLAPAVLAACLSFAAMPAAWAGQSEAESVLAECGMTDLPAAKVDECLERVRVAEETGHSPELLSLQARLEQRASNPQQDAGDHAPDGKPDDDDSDEGPGTAIEPPAMDDNESSQRDEDSHDESDDDR